jgi:hypothetical protein
MPAAIRSFEAPLSIEPVLGWRVWRLVRNGERLRLQALATPELWEPHEAIAS